MEFLSKPEPAHKHTHTHFKQNQTQPNVANIKSHNDSDNAYGMDLISRNASLTTVNWLKSRDAIRSCGQTVLHATILHFINKLGQHFTATVFIAASKISSTHRGKVSRSTR